MEKRMDSFSLLHRPRRLRHHPNLRDMVQETRLHPDGLIMPVFVHHGQNIRNEIPSMPGIFQWSIDRLGEEAETILESGIRSVILFGLPEKKDAAGSDTWNKNGIIQQALRFLKKKYPELYLITDVCFCEYTDHGHCGVIRDGDVDNDLTISNLAKQVKSHAEAGADMLAPSGMMDGAVLAIREALDKAGFSHLPIMSYAVKFASAFYGPFRDAADSAPQFGDRRSYQMNPANGREALREAFLDEEEGADILMIKPALAYLDLIRAVKEQSTLPIACYNVSGEYSMIKAAAQKGWIDEKKTVLESLTGMKRAGADIIITYFAKEAAQWLKGE
jgi:porphobilinogen synthase